MGTLLKPKFRDLPQGECAGAPILRKLWDQFDFSFLLTQSGIHKVRGVPSLLWTSPFRIAKVVRIHVDQYEKGCAAAA